MVEKEYTVHVAIGQYEFVEALCRNQLDAKNTYDAIKEAFSKPSEVAEITPISGLPTKDWQRCLDRYLVSGIIEEEDMTGMSENQSRLINEIKKAQKRIESKQ